MTSEQQSRHETPRRSGLGVLLAFGLLMAANAEAQPVILHLHNGDRLTGTLVSESANGVVLATGWNPALTVPLESIARRETVAAPAPAPAPATPPAADTPGPPPPAPAPPPAVKPAPVAAERPKPPPPSLWRTDLRLGADMIRGVRDRNIYFGTLALTYARPYQGDPKRFFRNRLEYRVDYATTDGDESANRMFGSNKTDFDIGGRIFIYNFLAAGYDDVRRIDFQYEVGPGAGYRLVRRPGFALNVEAGLNYQEQHRATHEDIQAWQSRIGQDMTWKIHERVTFNQKLALLSDLEQGGEFQLRFEGNLAIGLVKGLTFNLTALNLYDTRPVPGVTRNEFQLRSSLGLTF